MLVTGGRGARQRSGRDPPRAQAGSGRRRHGRRQGRPVVLAVATCRRLADYAGYRPEELTHVLVRGARLVNVRSRASLSRSSSGRGSPSSSDPTAPARRTVLEACVLVLQGDLLKAGNVRDLINRARRLPAGREWSSRTGVTE